MGKQREELTRIHEQHKAVETVRAAFDARWTTSALRRVDIDLADKLAAQVSKFHKALLVSDVDDVEKHGNATVRGYRRAIEVMDAADVEHDAYLVGQDTQSGLRVVVSRSNATATNPPDTIGDNVFIVQVDELARLLASVPNLAFLVAFAKQFPKSVVRMHEVDGYRYGENVEREEVEG